MRLRILKFLLLGMVLCGSAIADPALPGDIRLWFSADWTLHDSSGLVSSWLDRSTNYFQADPPAHCPLWVANSINGLPAVRFDGSNDFLEIAGSTNFTWAGDLTIFAVVKLDSSAGENPIVGQSTNGQAASFEFGVVDGKTDFKRGDGIRVVDVPGHAAIGAGAMHLLIVTVRGPSVGELVDAQPASRGTIELNPADCGAPLQIGRNGSGKLFNGEIAELLIFDRFLELEERQGVNDYLGAKYLPLTITKQPVDRWAIPFAKTSLTVEANVGRAQLQYQWQRKAQDSSFFEDIVDSEATRQTYEFYPNYQDMAATFRVKIMVQWHLLGYSNPARLGYTVFEGTDVGRIARDKLGANEVTVSFLGYMGSYKGGDPETFVLDHGARVLSATFDYFQNASILETTPLDEDIVYNLTIKKLQGFGTPDRDVTVPIPSLSRTIGIGQPYMGKVGVWWRQYTNEYVVESASTPNATSWTEVPGSRVDGFENYWSLAANLEPGSKFFRLRRK